MANSGTPRADTEPLRLPDLHMLNLVVADMAASLAFYRLLGAPAGPDAEGAAHVQLRMASGFSLELDTAESAALWHAGWRADPASVRAVLGFRLASPEEVDERYEALTGAGYVGRQPPYDAHWGARYAIVADPDGHDVGLMGPISPDRASAPSVPSPDV
jgi:catechol 2,3-dioxygenase-like lactoylglutathione lyase family enzyme